MGINISKEPKQELKEYIDFDFSILNDNPYNIDKQRFFNYKQLSQRLSSGIIDYSRIKNNDDFYEKAVRFLTRYAFGLFEFITKEKIPNIIFSPTSNLSYCGLDSNIIQIGIEILTQTNIPQQTKVDLLTGIIFHEQYHKKYTIPPLKQQCNLGRYENYYDNPKVRKITTELFPTKLEGVLNNILEDRRIEKLGSEDLPGYSFFFEELRKYALFLHADKKFVPQVPEAILLDYVLIKILIPELEERFMVQIDLYEEGLTQLSSHVDVITVTAMKQELNEIRNVLSQLKTHIEANPVTIFSDYFPDILKESKNLYNIFPKNMQEKLEEILKKNEIQYINITCEFGGESLNKGSFLKLTNEQLEKLQEIISDEIKNLESEKENKYKSSQLVERMVEQKINVKNANDNRYKIIQLIEEPIKPFDNALYNEAKIDAKNICNNLGFLDSKFNRVIENFELSEGELDEDDLYSLGFGNKHIFQEWEDLPGYSLDFGVLLDESGSMRSRIREAKRAFLALILGLKDNKHINLFAYGHTANHTHDSNDNEKLQLYKYYNTLENFTDWRRIFSATSRSNNADGYAIEKVAEIMKTSKSRNKILCVVSDGQPHAEGYGGELAERHVKSVVTRLENEGIIVIQICINYIENSSKMFKHFVQYEKSGKFFDNLKKILLGKLNQFADQV